MKKKSSQNKNHKPKNISLSLDCFGLSNAVYPYRGQVAEGEKESKPLPKSQAKAARDAISKAKNTIRAAHSVLLKYAGSTDYDIAYTAMLGLLNETLAGAEYASGLRGVNAPLLKIIAGHSYHWPVMVGIDPESWKAAREQVERIGLGTRIPIAEQYRNKKAFKPKQVTNAIARVILQTIIKTRDEVQQYDRNTLKHGRMNGEPVPEWICDCRTLPELTNDTVKLYCRTARKLIAEMKSKRASRHETAFEVFLRSVSPEW